MAKQNEALFEESSQGAVSAVTAVVFTLSIVLAFGGMIVSSYAFGAGDADIPLFAGGPVSYTHLDVYKRQILQRVDPSHAASPGGSCD